MPRPMGIRDTPGTLQGGVWMRAKWNSVKHLLFTAAALATLALAAGAKYRPS